MIDVENYLILVEGGPPSNYSAWSPDLPGCVAAGATVDACVRAMRLALAAHIELTASHDEAAPAPSGPGVYVARAATSVA
jgi:predicted RNase H-like HicB family nuclease